MGMDRTDGVMATHAYHPSRHPNGYWCPQCVGPASAAGVEGRELTASERMIEAAAAGVTGTERGERNG